MSTHGNYRKNQQNTALTAISLADTEIAEDVEIIEDHFHTVGRWYGFVTTNLSEGALTSFRVTTGATPAYGYERIMYEGTGISGSYLDFDSLKVTAVGDANRLSFIEWYEITKGTVVASTGSDHANERITYANTFVGDERILLTNLGTVTGPNLYTVYYVGTVNAAWFTLSLTPANAVPVLLGGADSAVSFCPVTRTLLSEVYVNRVSATPDTLTIPIKSRRISTSSLISCRGKSATGASTVDFLVGMHTYA